MKQARGQRKKGKTARTASYFPDVIKKEDVYDQYVEFCSISDSEKCEMLGIPWDEKRGRFASIPSISAFALKFGVSRKTLSSWKGYSEFHTAVEARQKEIGLDKLPNVLKSLYNSCIQYGGAREIELYLAFYANWDRKNIIKNDGRKYEMDDLRSLIVKLPLDKQQQFYGTIASIIQQSEISRRDTSSEGVGGNNGDQAHAIIVHPESDKPATPTGA